MRTEGLVSAERRSLFLYPSEEAHELTPKFVAGLSLPITLIVPDGMASDEIVATRSPFWPESRRSKLPTGPPSRYKLRKEPNDHSVSTFEAIARALGLLEREDGPRVQSLLEDLFDRRVERTLWARGVLKEKECRFPIPPEAREAFTATGVGEGRSLRRWLGQD